MSSEISYYLEKIDNLPGVSGYEEAVAEEITREVAPYCDEHFCDTLGNRIFIKKGQKNGPKVMVCAHMDEIGFVVRYIEENGMIRFAQIGYHDVRVLLGQDLSIHTLKGIVGGVTGTKPAHIVSEEELKRIVPLDEIYIDIGASSRKEAQEYGVQIGDLITYSRKGINIGTNIYSGKSVDNRSGCAVMMEVMRQLESKKIIPTVYFVASVMEEVGMRGAGTAANQIQPDEAIIIDVTLAGGMPDVHERVLPVKLGGGPAIKMVDWSPNNAMAGVCVSKKMTEALVRTADENGIPYQREVLINASTDAWSVSLSGSGISTGVLSIPSRYIHTPTGMVNLRDMEQLADLLIFYLCNFKSL